LLHEPFDAARQCFPKAGHAFDGVVEDYDGAVSCVATHVVEDLVGCEMARVVACNQVIHYYGVLFSDESRLLGGEKPMRGTEESTVDVAVGFFDVVQIIGCLHFESLKVVHGVVADSVSSTDHLLVDIGIFALSPTMKKVALMP
jgi:hypothetical protein